MDDFEWFKTPGGGSNCRCAETRETKVEPEDGTKSLNSHDKMLMQSCFLWMRKKQFPEMESIPSEDYSNHNKAFRIIT